MWNGTPVVPRRRRKSIRPALAPLAHSRPLPSLAPPNSPHLQPCLPFRHSNHPALRVLQLRSLGRILPSRWAKRREGGTLCDSLMKVPALIILPLHFPAPHSPVVFGSIGKQASSIIHHRLPVEASSSQHFMLSTPAEPAAASPGDIVRRCSVSDGSATRRTTPACRAPLASSSCRPALHQPSEPVLDPVEPHP